MSRNKIVDLYEMQGNKVVLVRGDSSVILATLDDTTGYLEFDSEPIEKRYKTAVFTLLAGDARTGDGRIEFNSVGIKGRKRDLPKEEEPDCPEMTPQLGDKTPAVVKWYFKWRPEEFKVKYGCVIDKKGGFKRVCCRREKWRNVMEDPSKSDIRVWEKRLRGLGKHDPCQPRDDPDRHAGNRHQPVRVRPADGTR